MPGYTVTVLGRELSFQTDIGEDRLQRVLHLVETRYAQLEAQGRNVGRERLLIYLALSLADECLQRTDVVRALENQIHHLVVHIDSAMHETLESA
jgi:cell division protein ZapA